MSILIKGLNMPKDDCEAYRELTITNHYIGNGKIQILAHDSITNEFIGEVVEVPEPHGRLIDAEKLPVRDVSRDYYEVMGVTEEDIDNAPTIIEAEE